MKDTTKFVVMSHGRAGTNFLMNNLKAHPDVVRFMEPFHLDPKNREAANAAKWRTGTSSKDFAYNMLFGPHTGTAGAVGFKLFYFHCREDTVSADLWDALLEDESVHIIFLNRRNLLNKYLSDLRAKASGIWHPKDHASYMSADYQTVTEVDVNTQLLVPVLTELYCGYHILKERFSKHPCRHYFFEDLETGGGAVMEDVFSFLGVENRGIAYPFRSGTLSRETTRIRNAQEVWNCLKPTVFSEYLDSCPLL